MIQRLDQLSAGQTAIVLGFNEQLGCRSQLLAMGLIPGARLKVSRLAPLGDPMQLELGNSSLSLRRSEAAMIRVERLP
ncbi:FeoA family protein [Endozoicomonadaceae bacterium StTr2]